MVSPPNVIMETHIRNETSSDIAQVGEIVRLAFPTDAESRLVDALRANGKAIISLVATQQDKILGHILFSPVTTTPPSDARGLGLAPVAVQPNAQGKGIGSQLIREGLRLCQQLGYDYCVVLGNPNYYQRFGFETASHFGMQNEYGLNHEFMVARLSNRELATGLIRYSSEFGLFSL